MITCDIYNFAEYCVQELKITAVAKGEGSTSRSKTERRTGRHKNIFFNKL